MDLETITLIKKVLPEGRTLFPYFKDKYAMLLLSYLLKKAIRICDIKKSTYNKLLQVNRIKNMLGKVGKTLTSDLFENYYHGHPEFFNLTLGSWGNNSNWLDPWFQTSRPGQNLVLKLNFGNKHNKNYKSLLNPTSDPFVTTCHPHHEKGGFTLAWSRLDIDLDAKEALIEEIQNDWIRTAFEWWKDLKNFIKKDNGKLIKSKYENWGISVENLEFYYKFVLYPYLSIWHEAMMSATIWFLYKELGVSKIYFHTWDSGCLLKNLKYSRPPRSIYTQLPKKFCFRKTTRQPEFIEQALHKRKKKIKDTLYFYMLDLDEEIPSLR